MIAKEFNLKFWEENDPITTPIWKALEAYHQAKIKEYKGSYIIKKDELLTGIMVIAMKELSEEQKIVLRDKLIRRTPEIKKPGPDLKAMEKQLDEALESETNESLTEWLNERRMKDKNYTEGIAGDGAAILYKGKQLTITEILDRLNRLDENSAWISVEDKLPEDGTFCNVIIETEERNLVHSCWFENGRWCYDNMIDTGEPLFATSWYASVTHWQPLPEPPKTDEG